MLTLAAGEFTLTESLPAFVPLRLFGTYRATSDSLTLEFVNYTPSLANFDMSLRGDTLMLTGGHARYDFNGDGVTEDARLNLVFARQ